MKTLRTVGIWCITIIILSLLPGITAARQPIPPLGVTALAFSADGRLGLAATSRGTKIWNLVTGKEVPCPEAGNWRGYCVAFLPGGKQIIMADDEGRGFQRFGPVLPVQGEEAATPPPQDKVCICDLATGKEVRSFRIGEKSRLMTFSADAKQALVRRGTALALWDVTAGKEVRTLGNDNFGGEYCSFAFSPDGKLVLATTVLRATNDWPPEGIIRILDATTGKEVRTLGAYRGPVGSTAFSPDGKLVLCASWEGTKIWDAATGKLVRTIIDKSENNTHLPSSATFTADSKNIVVAAALSCVTNLKVWSVETGKVVTTFDGNSVGCDRVAIAPDGKRVLASGNNIISLWDVASGEEIRTLSSLRFGGPETEWVAFSADGKAIHAMHNYGQVICWDATTWKIVRTFATLSTRPAAAAILQTAIGCSFLIRTSYLNLTEKTGSVSGT